MLISSVMFLCLKYQAKLILSLITSKLMLHIKSYLFAKLIFFVALFYKLKQSIDDSLGFYFLNFANSDAIC